MSGSSASLSSQAIAVLPQHVAVIMDGNGRWAKAKGLPRVEGHRQGAESVRAIVKTSGEIGIRYLTLYAFSLENWNRPKDEVDALMKYLARYLKNEAGEFQRSNVRLMVIGQIHRLPETVQSQLTKTIQALSRNTGLTLILALSYGGRAEIVDAVRKVATDVRADRIEPEEITEQVFAQYLYAPGVPDPDLLIRTSGEMRVSNFLLWQISYSEFVVSQTLWPDFRRAELFAAIETYARRHRRFGGV